MSLINKMLQDLESRADVPGTTANKKNAYEGLKPVKVKSFRSSAGRLIIMVFVVLFIGAGTYAWLQWGDLLFSSDKLAQAKSPSVAIRKAPPKPATMPAPAAAPVAVAAMTQPVMTPSAKQEVAPAAATSQTETRAPTPPASATVVKEEPKAISVATVQPQKNSITEKTKPTSNDGYWTVAKGETLYGISDKTGVELWDLSNWNRLGRNHVIRVGQRLRLTPPDASVAQANPSPDKKPEKKKTEPKKEKVFVASADASVVDDDASKTPAASATEPSSLESGVMDKKLKPLSLDEKSEDEYRVGVNFLQQGRSSDAEKHLRLSLSANPEHAKARELLAGLMLQSGHIQEAQQLLEQGVAKVPAHFPFAQLLARIYVDHASESKALAVMEASRKAGSANADYMAFLAALYQRSGKHADAVKAYTEAVTLNPQESRSWLGMGISLEATQDWNAASSAYQRAIDSGTLDSKLLQYAQQRLKIVKNK